LRFESVADPETPAGRRTAEGMVLAMETEASAREQRHRHGPAGGDPVEFDGQTETAGLGNPGGEDVAEPAGEQPGNAPFDQGPFRRLGVPLGLGARRGKRWQRLGIRAPG